LQCASSYSLFFFTKWSLLPPYNDHFIEDIFMCVVASWVRPDRLHIFMIKLYLRFWSNCVGTYQETTINTRDRRGETGEREGREGGREGEGERVNPARACTELYVLQSISMQGRRASQAQACEHRTRQCSLACQWMEQAAAAAATCMDKEAKLTAESN
jgi:hypothetical protein